MKNHKRNHANKKNTSYTNTELRPSRKSKCYFRNKWIWAGFAITIVIFLSIRSIYLQKEQDYEIIQTAEVVRVIDGDTIVVKINEKEERIRMIGVDAPESVSLDEAENSVYGELAAEYTKEHLEEGTIIYLTFDQEQTDQYGRTLAYIWTADDLNDLNNLYQRQMVQDGYALAIKYEPNTMYWQLLYSSMQEAAANRNGLWETEVFYNENREQL